MVGHTQFRKGHGVFRHCITLQRTLVTTKTEIVAIDFGNGDKLRMHGSAGPISKKDLKLPKVKGGKTAEDDFLRVLKHFLEKGYTVVTESPSVGSCGAEPKKVRDLMKNFSKNQFKLIAARAVKNYLQDNKIEKGDDAQSAEILYKIATNHPIRLKTWKYEEEKYRRIHKSVRPMDKRKYRDEPSVSYLNSIPISKLTPDITKYLNSPASLMPFIMALEEPLSSNRNGYQKVLGLYEHGYPSFYRRAGVDLMQDIAKDLAKVSKMEDVDPATRKAAWKLTQKLIRKFYAICKNHKIKQT